MDPDALIRGVWMKLGGIEGNAAAGEREPLLGPDVDVSIDRDRDPVDAGVDRPPESFSPRELLNANVATEPRTKTKTGGARRKVVFDVDETLAEPLGAAGGGDLGETAPPEAEEDREARAAAAAERAAKKARRAAGACQGGAGGRGAETGDEYDTKKTRRH